MSAKRNLWSAIGKVLWTIISFAFRIAARLGSTWARKKLDERRTTTSRNPVRRVLHHRRTS